MANPNNVELEAAKFLHKLIQESKDEPTKLATKLYVILQHMRSSGKENSMPYQVISRAMETVVKQHGLDIESLMSSCLPMSAAAQVGEATSSQVAGSSQRPGVTRDSKANSLGNEMVKPDAYTSSSAVSGPSGSGHGIYQASAPHISGTGVKVPVMAPSASNSSQPVEPGISGPMQFGRTSIDNHGYAAKLQKDGSTGPFSGSTSVDLVAGRTATGRALEHEGGSSMLGNASKINQGGMPNNVPEKSILRSETIRDAGKLPVAAQAPVSAMPFKEHHLKQLRAQCLVFLAFRNGLIPKKPHLEIALGNFHPKEDRRELVDHKGREQLVADQGSASEVTRTFGGSGEIDRLFSGPTPSGIVADTNSSMEAENANLMEDKNGQLDPSEHADQRRPQRKMRMIQDAEVPIQDATESQASALGGVPTALKSLPPCNHGHAPANTEQLGMFPQASSVMGTSKQMKPDLSGWGGTEASKLSPPSSANTHVLGLLMKDNHTGQSQNLIDTNAQGNRHADSNLPSLPLRQQWKSVPGVINQSPAMMQVKDSNIMLKNLSQVQETDQEDENISASTDRLSSPRHTMLEKWILDRQKRKHISEQKWSKKQQKTGERIAACAEKLKESVSSSKDISAKTKSVIELKKLQLLELQRRIRSEILNDFFKPIATDMERLKSIKKHRIGRKSKQLERYEQRMKEERQKRIRERQKEFFSEIEVHRERLEDVFKMKRERWKGFNKYVKEFHKRKERIHREKIDRIQREKINLLKINDVEGYLRMVQDAKSDRVKQLLKETEKYLQKLGSKLKQAKSIARKFETDMGDNRNSGVVEEDDIDFGDEDETDQAKHYLESNEKYYMMAHSIKETITAQPSSLKGGKLREYQMNGLRWLVSLYNNHLNGILADEMGLGKTVQVISLMCYLMETKNDRGPFLVVVPSSVLPGWESEINFWAPDMLKIVYSGPPEERRRLFKERIVHQKFNVLLTTYEYLMNKHDRPKLSKVHWHYIIIDEGHRIKNASCKLNADLKHYRSNHRLLLTGTPLQNNLEELWALLNFLLPNIFNSSEDFSQWFNKPFESGDNSPDEALLSEEENLLIINRLHQVLRPFVLRRLKHKVENELPEKIERLVRCEASSYQKLLMKRVEDNLGAFGTSKARSVHNSVMELRNICNHPYLSQLHVEEVHELIPKHYLPTVVRLCGKLEMLDKLLPKLKATDHRVLLFSTMTRLLDVMEDYLCWKQYKYLRLDGHTSGGDRGALIDKFNQPNSPFFIFLLSIRAGGVGVNLQAADTVIIFDTDWNPQVDLQAQARAHRIGQKKDVLVLRLETAQTVEEQVRAAAEHKLGVANQSITAGFFDNNTSAEDRREYLESLLRESKKEEAAPVLDDDSLNDLIARSEPEIDVFESVDRRRREEEMEVWKKLCSESGTQSSELIPPLPSRLLTDDDLKPFHEAMKISDKPVVAPNPGLKRKGESLGGLDIQHYGRGKRAREVRSYEEQWTEEEFEKMCLAESPQSPSLREEIQEKNFPLVSGTCPDPVVAISEIQTPAPYQLPPQQPVQEVPQQLVGPIVQQSPVTVTPPSKRGRGRPRRTAIVTEISPSPVVISAIAASVNVDSNTIAENTSTNQATCGPVSVSFPCASSIESTSATIPQNVTGVAPSYQSIVPSVAVASQSGPPCAPTSGQGRGGGRGRGRGRKPQTGGEAPGRRGRRQNVTAEAFPTPPTQAVSEPVSAAQGVNVMSSSGHHVPPTSPAVGKPDLMQQVVAGLGSENLGHDPASARDAIKELNSVVPHAASSTSKELSPVSTVSVIPSSPASQDPSSISPAPVPQSSSRYHSEDHLSLSAARTEATLQANTISVVPHSLPSAGKEPSYVSPVPIHSSTSKDSNSVLPAPVPASSSACAELSSVCPLPAVASSSSISPNSSALAPLLLASNATGKLDSGSDRGTFSCSSSISGHDSVCDSSNLKSIGQQESGIVTAHTSDPVPSLPAISSVSQYSTPPTASKPGRGRGYKPQTGSEAPRRRGKRQDLVTAAGTEGLGAQDPGLIEPPQKKTRLSVGRKPSTRSKRENETQQVVDHSVASRKTTDFSGGLIPQNIAFSEVNSQNNAINRDASQSHAILVPSQVGDNVNCGIATAEEVLGDAPQKTTVVQSVTSQSCSGPRVEPQTNTVNSDDSPAQEVQEQTAIVQSDASQKVPCPSTRQIPRAIACCEVELHNNAIKSDASQASGDVATFEAAITNEVLGEDQQTIKVQSAASQTPSVHSVEKMLEDIVSNEVQPQCDAIRTDASQSHVPLASSGSVALVTDSLVEKSEVDSKGEGVEKTQTNPKDGSNMEVPIGALELTSSGNLNKNGDSEGQASSSLNGVLPTSSESVPCPTVKAEVYLGSEGSGKVSFNLGSTQSLSESVFVKTDVEQLQTEDVSLDKSFVSKANTASIEHLSSGRFRKEQETGDAMEEETVVSPAVGTDNQNMKAITSFASPFTEAEALVDEPPLCGSYKPAKEKLEVAAEGTHSYKVAISEVCVQDKLSVNASLKITEDLSSMEKEKYMIPETFEKQVNVADSLTEKCGSDRAAQGPDMKDSDVSEVAPSPRNESRSIFTVGISQSEPERQAIAEANSDPGIPKTFPSSESGAQKKSLSPRLASNAEAVDALTETFASHHDTNYVAELQGNLSFDVKDALSNSEANVSQLSPAAGSSENHPELKQVVVEDMGTKTCEESASDEIDDIVLQQTEKADGQCLDDLSVETHESKRSVDNVDVLNDDLKKPLSSTIAETSKKVADLELVAEENTGRIDDGTVDSGQVAEKSEDMAIQDLTVEGRESEGMDTAGDTSATKNEVESQSSVVENIEKMYNKSVASGEVTAAELLIERSEHLHVLDHTVEAQGNKGFDATRYVPKSSPELHEAQPGGTSQIGTELQLVAEEDSQTMNKENTLPDATAVKPQPAIFENFNIRDPAHQLPKSQQSDATEDFSTSNIDNESQAKAADGTYEIAVESHLVSKQNMEIHVDVAIGDATAGNAAVGNSENLLSIVVAVEEKGKKESDVTDEISNSELSEPKTSPSAIEVKTICEELGMTDKEVAPLEVEVVETPFRDMPGCSGRDLAIEGQEKEKSATSKGVSNPVNEEPKCSPGVRAADNGAESQLVAERDAKTVLTKEVFSGKEEHSSIRPAGDEDVPTATEYGDQVLSYATGAGDDKTVATTITDA